MNHSARKETGHPIGTHQALVAAVRKEILRIVTNKDESYQTLANRLSLSKTHIYRLANDPNRSTDLETLLYIARELNIGYRIIFEFRPD